MAEEKQSTSVQGPPPYTGGPPPYQQQSLGGAASVAMSNTVSALNQPVYLGGTFYGFGEHSTRMTCPHCNREIITSTTYVTGTLTWLLAGFIIMVGLWLGCCLIPFFIDGCKDVEHTCPHCKQLIGVYRRL